MGMTGPGQTIGVSVFIDHFSDDLELSKNAVSAGYAVGTLTGSLMLPSVGRWIDRFGVRHAMTVITIGFVIALTAMAGVQGLLSLTLGFVFIRMLGQGSLSLVSMVSVSLWFERRRGLALGVAMTVSSAMMALFPVTLSYLIGEAGWRSAWLIAAGAVGPDWNAVTAVKEVDVLTTNEDGNSRETTIWFTLLDGQAYIRTSGSTTWGDNVERNPDIALRIEEVEYLFHAAFITDEAKREKVVASFRKKYGWIDGFLNFVRGSSPRIMRLDSRD